MGGLDFWVPTYSPPSPTQVAGNSNSFLSRLLNRDTITRISYKSESPALSLVGACMHRRGAEERCTASLWLVHLQMTPTFFKT